MLTMTRTPLTQMPYTPTVTVEGRSYYLDDFNDMDRLALAHIRRSVEGELHEIMAQLEAEEIDPVRDNDWLIRATRAKRAFTRALRHIDATIEIRKLEHQGSMLQQFINLAEQELPSETFKSLLRKAHNQANK